MFTPILYIYLITIAHIYQELSFKGCQIAAENKLDEDKVHVQHGYHALTKEAVTDEFSRVMIGTCCIPHSDRNQAKIFMVECWK